ncbi:DoxX family protein [Candidatus Microgenomates bacterium]|nr:DoxX family protein [Candidatus Microgenomates bacterium]
MKNENVSRFQKVSLILLRLSLGWMFFYSGITKMFNSDWSAAGYLKVAKTLPDFYQWLSSPDIINITNFLNEWGQLLIGVALLLGIFTRFASIMGVLLMALYYLPILDFPYPNAHAFIVDEHVIYAFALLVLASFRAGRSFGLENWCSKLPICSRFPRLRNFLG